jgi:hypothetical protein
MLGFEVSLKDRTVTSSIGDDGVLYVIVSYVAPKNCYAHLGIGGLDSFEHKKWHMGNIDDVDKVTIRVVDAAQNSPVESTPQDRVELLEQYHALKKELEAEGLL